MFKDEEYILFYCTVTDNPDAEEENLSES